MRSQYFLLFYPERIAWIGASVLGGGAFLGMTLLAILWSSSICDFYSEPKKCAPVQPLTFSLGLKGISPALVLPQLENEVTFSFDPPRPSEALRRASLFVRLKKSAQSKRVSLPCRLDLEYLEGETLAFSEKESPFWLELSISPEGQIEGRAIAKLSSNETMEGALFSIAPQEGPIQSLQEFGEGTPFRILAEARWWGPDLFREKYENHVCSHRFEIGSPSHPEFVELREEEWLVWEEGKWRKVADPVKEKPIARIEPKQQGKPLTLEGWEGDHHIRLSFAAALPPPFRAKAEELFSLIRVRSEKQISCMLEKQCLILRPGDWVLKNENRWKILRKKEEKKAYREGKLVGELFVFEKIDVKQGQKFIQGALFSAARTQLLSVEMPALSHRKGKEDSDRSGRKRRIR